MADAKANTAYGPAILTALEQSLPREQRIVDDSVAYQMLPGFAQWMIKACNVKPIGRAMFRLMEGSSPGIPGGIVCRKRYIQDKLNETLKAGNDPGIDAVVILGAGLDTLAYRIPQLSAVHVYEVDLPQNSDYKKKKLEAFYGQVPSYVSLISTDFETHSLDNRVPQQTARADRVPLERPPGRG